MAASGVGKHIVESLSIPKVDFLSCTIAGTPWINHEWLFQVLVYSVYRHGGIEGLIDLKAALLFLRSYFCASGLHTRAPAWPFGCFAFGAVGLSSSLDVAARYVQPVLLCPLYLHFRSGPGQTPVLMVGCFDQVLWTNIHGFFIFGPILVADQSSGGGIKRRIRLPFEWNQIGRLSRRRIYTFEADACSGHPCLPGEPLFH